MANILNTMCFTTLLFVVLLISAGIPKSEAKCDKFIGEGPEGTPSNPCMEKPCLAACEKLYPETCGAECEIHDNEDHCHCLGQSEPKCDEFIGEGPEGTPSNPCKQTPCLEACKKLFPTTCGAECEIHDNEDHCHCLGQSKPECDKFIGEGPEGTPSNPCKQAPCLAACKKLFPATCGAECEIHDNEDHCHCLGH